MPATKWTGETDVVVLGYGAAGAVAAMSAHDAGVKAIILEKGEYPGGVTVTSGGGVKYVAGDVARAAKYFDALSWGRMEADVIEAFVQGLAENLSYAKELAKVDGAQIAETTFKGSSYLFDGGEVMSSFKVTSVPGFNGFPWSVGKEFGLIGPRAGQCLFKMLMDNVEARGIETMLSTRAATLVTDRQGAVVGVEAESQGKRLRIRARKGVVLACGGFEQNEWLRLHCFEGRPLHSMAPFTNTGDGLIMAQKLGAALWHMWLVHGSYGFKFDECPLAMRHNFSGHANPDRKMPWIIVDKNGRRYMNENPPAPQDTPFRFMQVLDPDLPGYPRIPSYMLFDERGRRQGAIGNYVGDEKYYYEWSADNSREIEKGWIVSGGSIGELAKRLKGLPSNQGRMEAAVLEETVARWNQHVKSGGDPFNRTPATAMALETPPFYGVEVWPIINNTHGGPVHNAKQQVVDASGSPIPRLYIAGELGSFINSLYELGSNLAECLSSGRVAGKNAALEESLR
ncbi:MAG: FAD-binding protein [Chloroflexi bacterium]|nr:FAD-binding protein [Chloroflexota bacterium]